MARPSTVKEMDKVSKTIKMLIELYRSEAIFVVSNQLYARNKAIATVDFLTPKIRDITTFYIRKFCGIKSVVEDQTRLLFLKKLVLDVRANIWLPLAKTYAKMLRVPMDKKEKVMYE